MKTLPLSIVLGILLFAAIVPSVADAETVEPEHFSDPVIIHTFKSKSFQFVISEESKTAYRYVEILTFYAGHVLIYENDILTTEYDSEASGSKILKEYSPGNSIDLKIVLGSVVKNYSFKVQKNISIKDIDPDSEEIFTLTQSELTSRILLYCAITFVCACIGIYTMYFYFRRKASREVRSLV